MFFRQLVTSLSLMSVIGITGCAFEPVKNGYSKAQVKTTTETLVAPHDSLLVFRTSGFKLWENQEAEFIVNGAPVAWFKSGGARYLPLQAGQNSIVVREPDHFLKCELTIDFEPGSGQFVEIYERFEPSALMVGFIFADLTSRLSYDPHPGSKCGGVYGLSMGHLKQQQLADVHREFSFQVVQR